MDIFTFAIPEHEITFFISTEKDKILETVINDHIFNCAIDFIIPNSSHFPDDIKVLLKDARSDYVIVKELPLFIVLDKEFVEAFIKSGELWMISTNEDIDTGNSAAITSGHLLLSCKKATYEKLGLQGKQCCKFSKNNLKHVITVDLTSDAYKPGKRYYEQVQEACQRTPIKFDFALQWKPQDLTNSIASIQKYFTGKGYDCCIQHPAETISLDYSLAIPKLHLKNGSIENYEIETLYEWIGAQLCLVSCELKKDSSIICCPPEPITVVGQVLKARWNGLYSSHKISEIIQQIRCFLKRVGNIPFIIITIHPYYNGFNIENDGHKCLQSQEKNYCIILFPDKNTWVYRAVKFQK